MYYPKLQILIDHLQSVDESDFNMVDGRPNGPCCVGGHAERILNRDKRYSGVELQCEEALNKLCDLPIPIGCHIAFYYPVSLENNPKSKDIAVKMLENLRDTGEMNWYV